MAEESDPSEITRWVVRHPVGWGLISGAAAAMLGLFIFNFSKPVVFILIGTTFGALNALGWREGGFMQSARAWVVENYPKKS